MAGAVYAGSNRAMATSAKYRWICLVGGLLTTLLSMASFTLAIRDDGHASARQQVFRHLCGIPTLTPRDGRRGPQIADRDEVLAPQPCELNEDGSEDSDGSERLTVVLPAWRNRWSCAASLWATHVSGLLNGAIAPLAPARLQI